MPTSRKIALSSSSSQNAACRPLLVPAATGAAGLLFTRLTLGRFSCGADFCSWCEPSSPILERHNRAQPPVDPSAGSSRAAKYTASFFLDHPSLHQRYLHISILAITDRSAENSHQLNVPANLHEMKSPSETSGSWLNRFKQYGCDLAASAAVFDLTCGPPFVTLCLRKRTRSALDTGHTTQSLFQLT
jgi:hypothetical protein